jgi:hypothetical protein
MYLQKVISKNNWGKFFVVALLKVTDEKIAGSGAGSESVSQNYGSADPDPFKNFTDPQPTLNLILSSLNGT